MPTYVLTAFRPCHHETASRLRRTVLGPCRCGLMGRARTVFCAVEAASPQEASAKLGSPMLVQASAHPGFPDLDTATYYSFHPSSETYAIVARAYYALRKPGKPRPEGAPTLREAVRTAGGATEVFNEDTLASFLEMAEQDVRADTETMLRAALEDRRLDFYLMLAPEVPRIGVAESQYGEPPA